MGEGEVPKYKDDNHVPAEIRSFLRNEATHVFYAFHWYGGGVFPSLNESIANAKSLSALWKAPPVITEYHTGPNGETSRLLDEAGVHRAYYMYDSYCSVPARGSSNCTPGMPCAFGACIT